MKKGTSGSVSVVMTATPDEIYDAVSDVTRVGEFSPECARARWLDGATAAAPGVHFKGTNKRGPIRWSTKPVVIIADRGSEFSFVTSHRGHEMTRWRYLLRPVHGGTEVTESFELLADLPWYLRIADRVVLRIQNRQEDMRQGMQQTLSRLDAAVTKVGRTK